MALLVMVDLMCWLPLAVVGLAATFAANILVGLPVAKVWNAAVHAMPAFLCGM